MKFRPGDKVKTATGVEGVVTFTEDDRRRVVVRAENNTVEVSAGTQKVFFENEVRKA